MKQLDTDSSSSRVASEESTYYRSSDRFVLLEEIPSAGYNRLVKAQRYGKYFVLKGIKPEYAENNDLTGLLRKEFELAIQMDHPNIVRIYSFEEVATLGSCIVMEYVDGCPLNEYITRHPSLNERRRIAQQLVSALEHVHARQTVHRDLKPSNILITRNGSNVKLIDFGLSDADQYAILKEPAYTIPYASPEQIAGSPLDARSDIYSLGKVLGVLFPHRYRRVKRCCCRYERSKRYTRVQQVGRHFSPARRVLAFLLPVLAACLMVWAGWQMAHLNSREFSYKLNESQVLRCRIVDGQAHVVGHGAMSGQLVLPESIKWHGLRYPLREISAKAFEGCDSITGLRLPEALWRLQDNAFSSCSSIGDTLVLPLGLRFIGQNVFTDCSNLHVVVVKSARCYSDKTPAKSSRFHNNQNLSTVIIDSTVQELGQYLFCFTFVRLSEVRIAEGVTHLSEATFSECANLKDIYFPSTMKLIDAAAFYNTAVERVIIPPTVEEVGQYAFACCRKCRYLEIGEGVERMGASAFAYMPAVDTIVFRSAKPPHHADNTFLNSVRPGLVCMVPESSLSEYQSDTVYSALSPRPLPAENELP